MIKILVLELEKKKNKIRGIITPENQDFAKHTRKALGVIKQRVHCMNRCVYIIDSYLINRVFWHTDAESSHGQVLGASLLIYYLDFGVLF